MWAQQPAPKQGPIATDGTAVTVKLDDLEDKPENFVGKTVTVESEVDKLIGPHLHHRRARLGRPGARAGGIGAGPAKRPLLVATAVTDRTGKSLLTRKGS
jgi:hypothetical protein